MRRILLKPQKLVIKIGGRYREKWYANGDEIIEFLNSINPYIDKEEFRKMFYEHLALTKAEALAFLNKDYEAGVKLYDKIEKKH